MNRIVSYFCCAAVAVGIAARPALAIPQFFNEFKALYADPDGTDEQKALAETIEAIKPATLRCNICHEGKDKKKRNVYGEALAELLDKKEDKDNKEKIKEALEKVGEMKLDPDDEKSPTFGDILKEGKLVACGSPEEVKQGGDRVLVCTDLLTPPAEHALRDLGVDWSYEHKVLIEAPPAQVFDVIRVLEEHSLPLVSVQPLAETLESAFLRLAA